MEDDRGLSCETDPPCGECTDCLWRKVGELTSDLISAEEARDAAHDAEAAMREENKRVRGALELLLPDWIGQTSNEIAECLKDCHSEFGIRFTRARAILDGRFPVEDSKC